ncbi:MAG: alpha/beta hydrolase [Kofleriaceae bacterium]
MSELREVTVDGKRLAYLEQGSGEPVVLVHGYPQTHRAWRHQIEPLAKTHRVIAIDWPGFGRSEGDLAGSTGYADEVARLGRILDALAIDRCTLVGHDYGGYIALGFVIAQPERVSRLAILNSRAHETFPRLEWWARFWTIAASRHARWALSALSTREAVNRNNLEPYVKAGCFDHTDVDEYVGWMGTPAGMDWYVKFFASYDLRARREQLVALGKLAIPTAIIWGDSDPYSPIATARELAAALPDATLTEIPHGLHFIMEHRPNEVTAALAVLLARPAAGAITASPAGAQPAPTPARASPNFREAVLAGWAWVVCAGLIALGAVGLFTESIGPLGTNRLHALILNLGVGFAGYAFARFHIEQVFVLVGATVGIGLGILGFLPATQPWLYTTFNLDAWSSWSELVVGIVCLVMWLVLRPKAARL